MIQFWLLSRLPLACGAVYKITHFLVGISRAALSAFHACLTHESGVQSNIELIIARVRSGAMGWQLTDNDRGVRKIRHYVVSPGSRNSCIARSGAVLP